MTVYSHAPLPTASSIRLIHLHSSIPHRAPLKCSTSIEDLSDEPPPAYEALSYEWAPPFASGTQLYPLICNEQFQIGIRQNLNDALHHLRPKIGEPPRALWVDAICINQADNGGKSVQVRRMKEIYEKATQVVGWLGKGDDGIAEAMEVACRVHRFYCRKDYAPFAEYDGRIEREAENVCFGGVASREVPGKEPRLEDWTIAAKVYERSYFSRLWMVQELVVAQRARVICGAFETDFRCIRDFAVSSFVYKSITADAHTKSVMQEIENMESMAIPLLQYRSRNGANGVVDADDLSWLL